MGGRSSSNPGLAKSGSGQTSSMGQASSGNSQENGLSSEGNRGLTENRQSFGGMFDEMFGKMHTAGAHAKDFSETVCHGTRETRRGLCYASQGCEMSSSFVGRSRETPPVPARHRVTSSVQS